MAKCTAITRGGGRCRGVAIDVSGLCYAHHPDHEQDRLRAARKGGKRGGRGRSQVEVNTVKSRLLALAEDTLAGRVDKGVATVVNQIWGTYLRACGVGLDVEERQDLLARLEVLEESLQHRGGGYNRGA